MSQLVHLSKRQGHRIRLVDNRSDRIHVKTVDPLLR